MEVITSSSGVTEIHAQPFSLLSQELRCVSPHGSGFIKMTQAGPAAGPLVNSAEDNEKLIATLGMCWDNLGGWQFVHICQNYRCLDHASQESTSRDNDT